jgi:anti-sigma factor (TIGR02949 family)
LTTDELDCDAALELLHDYLKREIPPELAPVVERHLERCAPCFTHARFEEKFLQLLSARSREIRCPEALRRRISESLRQPT